MSTDLFSVSSNVSTYHALKNIEANEYGTVIVTNDQKVVGTLSDGDIRKILLTHHMLTIPVKDVMNQNFISIFKGQIEEGEKIFSESFFIRLIPIVDSNGKLLGVFKRGNQSNHVYEEF